VSYKLWAEQTREYVVENRANCLEWQGLFATKRTHTQELRATTAALYAEHGDGMNPMQVSEYANWMSAGDYWMVEADRDRQAADALMAEAATLTADGQTNYDGGSYQAAWECWHPAQEKWALALSRFRNGVEKIDQAGAKYNAARGVIPVP
jgi:hypothetical protein